VTQQRAQCDLDVSGAQPLTDRDAFAESRLP